MLYLKDYLEIYFKNKDLKKILDTIGINMIRLSTLKKAPKGKENRTTFQDWIIKIILNLERFNNKKLWILIFWYKTIKSLLKCEITMIFRIILEKKV